MHRIEPILIWNGWDRTESKVMQGTFFHKGDEHWLVDSEESVSFENLLLELWNAAAKCRELAVPDPVNLMQPWMPIAMALQAVDSEKLFQAIINFIDVYNYKREGQGAKEDIRGITADQENHTEEN
jgi:hypothetical protein